MQSFPLHAFSSRTAANGSCILQTARAVFRLASLSCNSPQSAIVSSTETAVQNGMRPDISAPTASSAVTSTSSRSSATWSKRRRMQRPIALKKMS